MARSSSIPQRFEPPEYEPAHDHPARNPGHGEGESEDQRLNAVRRDDPRPGQGDRIQHEERCRPSRSPTARLFLIGPAAHRRSTTQRSSISGPPLGSSHGLHSRGIFRRRVAYVQCGAWAAPSGRSVAPDRARCIFEHLC